VPCRSLVSTTSTRRNAFAPPNRPITQAAARSSSSSPMNGGETPRNCASERPRPKAADATGRWSAASPRPRGCGEKIQQHPTPGFRVWVGGDQARRPTASVAATRSATPGWRRLRILELEPVNGAIRNTFHAGNPVRSGREPATMAATNKCLAQCNKSRRGPNATKKQPSPTTTARTGASQRLTICPEGRST
jgi:hypothetical protein